jgi:hypothetical protein
VALVLKDGLNWLVEQDKEGRGGVATLSPETDQVFALLEARARELQP